MNKSDAKIPYIQKRHFKTCLTCQPFFIWHALDHLAGDEWDESELGEFVWSDDFIEANEISIGQRIAKTFNLISNHLVHQLEASYDAVILKGNIDERLSQTQQLLTSGKLIISPAFLTSHHALATPFAFDTASGTIINLAYAARYSRLAALEGYYDFKVLEACGVTVKDYQLYALTDKESRYWQKGEISLTPHEVAVATKTKKAPGEDDAQTFMEAFDCRYLIDKRGNHILLPDFEATLTQIEAARQTSQLDFDLSCDVTTWGANQHWNDLLDALDSPYAFYSGHLLKKQTIVESIDLPLADALDRSIVGKALNAAERPLVNLKLLKAYDKLIQAKKVVWYDFEGFSLPFAALDHTKPYQQIVFQVSVIVTHNTLFHNLLQIETQSIKNLVLDPLHLTSADFQTIIETIFQVKADAYVVYNKSYELARLREMATILALEDHPYYLTFLDLLNTIEALTIDLYDDFRIYSNRVMPAILLHDQKGRASIKNIERHINAMRDLKLHHPITPYKSLRIQNGAMAMEVAIDRALGIIGDKVWQTKVKELKSYCENDVKAMIMVFEYEHRLVEEAKGGIN